jgi:hypothetical protein
MYARFNVSGRVDLWIYLESVQSREVESEFGFRGEVCVFWEYT